MVGSSTTSKLLITFPNKLWLGELSREFPYFQFEIKAFVPISHDPFIGNSLITITGHKPSQILPKLDTHPSLVKYSIMEQNESFISINTQTNDQFLLMSIVKNLILVQLPFKIANGIAEFIISSTRENIDKFIDDLTSKGISVEIKSIGHFSEDLLKEELTSRQFFIFQEAKKAGYYDVPRKITLTDLAQNLDIAKSSLSSMLQRIHNKLLGYIG
ncbi:hypothetical protein NEF87_000354 [Candidatus Lokiarchaeum ossiferum]|uniref:HTH bat-type domain-containing protein n=1 Tax=Candidatus Lokiarchaeum ossiferum TaxID=2951803 RepID=A0ABY6HNK3_9ARCH|nr:hypothetical protein NEF87_000354 [Candidatus Lokiarchaeum sp. B-35]